MAKLCLAWSHVRQEAFAAGTPQPFASLADSLGGAKADPSRQWVCEASLLAPGWHVTHFTALESFLRGGDLLSVSRVFLRMEPILTWAVCTLTGG